MARMSEKQRQALRWTLIIFGLLAFYFAFSWLRGQATLLLQADPAIWAAYKGLEAEVVSGSLWGFFIAMFAGSLFITAIPVEVVFLLYLGLDYPFLVLFGIALSATVIGNFVNFLVGYAVGPRPLRAVMKEKYSSFHDKVDRAGGFVIVVGNIVPFPSDLFALFLGTVRYSPAKFLLFTAIGKGVQYFLFWLMYKYLVLYLGPYVHTLSLPWLLDVVRSSFGA